MVAKLEPKNDGIRCELRDGRSLLLPSEWNKQIRIADRLLIDPGVTTVHRDTPFYLERRRGLDVCQVSIVAAGKPKRNREGIPVVCLDATSSNSGVSRALVKSAQIRDYFFAPDRSRTWQGQPSWHDVLGVSEASTPAMVRLAFQVRQLELKLAGSEAPARLAQLARGFQILMEPELQRQYFALRADPDYPASFPPCTIGRLLATGVRRNDIFFVERIVRFLPAIERQVVRVPLRKLRFTGAFAVYRNNRRKILIRLDAAVLPLPWTDEWNEWVHLTLGRIEVNADFWQQTRFRRHEGGFERVVWQRPATSTLIVKLPGDLVRKFDQAHLFWVRLRPHADKMALLRSRIEHIPVERGEAVAWCGEHGLPETIDVRLVNWHPDYEETYYRELASEARAIYLFRNEYLFAFDRMLVAEIPQFGHASYFFRPTTPLRQFLDRYAETTRHQIRCDREKSRQTLGYCGRLAHSRDIQTWIQKVRERLL